MEKTVSSDGCEVEAYLAQLQMHVLRIHVLLKSAQVPDQDHLLHIAE